MGLSSKKNTEPATDPTPEQIRRYAQLRDSGYTPLEATRTVRAEAARRSRS